MIGGIPAKKDIVYHDDPPSVLFCDRLPAKNLVLLVVLINEPLSRSSYISFSLLFLFPLFFFSLLVYRVYLDGMIRFNGNINFYVLNTQL